jgi:hypothetical protein
MIVNGSIFGCGREITRPLFAQYTHAMSRVTRDFGHLSLAERIELVDDIWDSIPVAGSEAVARTEAEREEVPGMSPTVFREAGFRFYFFSREEPRMHVHVHCADGEAKFWLEPHIEVAQNVGMSERQIRAAQALVEDHVDEIRRAWQQHFGA